MGGNDIVVGRIMICYNNNNGCLRWPNALALMNSQSVNWRQAQGKFLEQKLLGNRNTVQTLPDDPAQSLVDAQNVSLYRSHLSQITYPTSWGQCGGLWTAS
jgi:hypothetical protein